MAAVSGLIIPELDTYLREQTARWTVPGVVLGVLLDGLRVR